MVNILAFQMSFSVHQALLANSPSRRDSPGHEGSAALVFSCAAMTPRFLPELQAGRPAAIATVLQMNPRRPVVPQLALKKRRMLHPRRREQKPGAGHHGDPEKTRLMIEGNEHWCRR